MQKTYLITGAGHFPGIGSCLAEKLLKSNHNVVVNSRTLDDQWTKLNSQYPYNLRIVKGDISDQQVQDKLITEAVDNWGSIDTLVNNASTTSTNAVPNRDNWSDEFLINVTVPYELSLKVSRYLEETQGSIIMIGSRVGIQVTSKENVNNLCYSIAKSAMHHLTKSLAVTLGPNIRVNAIAPGMIETARLKNKFNDNIEELKQKFVKNSLLKNTVNIDSLIDSVIFLADNSSITGQILSVCNGASVNKIS